MKPHRWNVVNGWCMHGVSDDSTCSCCADRTEAWNSAIEEAAKYVKTMHGPDGGKLCNPEHVCEALRDDLKVQ